MKVKRDSSRVQTALHGQIVLHSPQASLLRRLTLINVLSGSCLFIRNLPTVHLQCIVLAKGLRDSVRMLSMMKLWTTTADGGNGWVGR